jgi:hypothetical protein
MFCNLGAKHPFNFCESDYAISSLVREFWNFLSVVLSIVFLTVMFCARVFRGYRFSMGRLGRQPHSWSGHVHLFLSILYFMDGVRIHSWACERVLTLEVDVLVPMLLLAAESRSLLFPVSMLTPLALRAAATATGLTTVSHGVKSQLAHSH